MLVLKKKIQKYPKSQRICLENKSIDHNLTTKSIRILNFTTKPVQYQITTQYLQFEIHAYTAIEHKKQSSELVLPLRAASVFLHNISLFLLILKCGVNTKSYNTVENTRFLRSCSTSHFVPTKQYSLCFYHISIRKTKAEKRKKRFVILPREQAQRRQRKGEEKGKERKENNFFLFIYSLPDLIDFRNQQMVLNFLQS